MLPTDSVTSLNFPEETLKTKILSVSGYDGEGQISVDELEATWLQDSAAYRASPIYGAGLQEYAAKSQYILGTLEASISGFVEIININRTSFGSYDEATVTWGLALKSATVNLVYRIMGWP